MASSEPAPRSDTELIRRWRIGDHAAAEELYVRYAERLWRLAEREIGTRLRRRVTADDIVESVFRTFFTRTARGEFSIAHSGALGSLLEEITRRKVRRQWNHHTCEMRNVHRETYPDEVGSDLGMFWRLPTEEDAVDFVDALEILMRQLDAREAEIVRLILDDFQINDIAKCVGCSRWTVRRVLDRVGTLMYPLFGGRASS